MNLNRQIGDPRFVVGAFTRRLVPHGGDALLVVESGARSAQIFGLDGELRGTLGPHPDYIDFVASDGELVLLGSTTGVTCWRGGTPFGMKELTCFGVGVANGRGYVATTQGLLEIGNAKLIHVWGADVSSGPGIVRPDLVVTWRERDLWWSTPDGTAEFDFKTEIRAVAELGDAIAIAETNGTVWIGQGGDLNHVMEVPPKRHGEICSLGGDARWLAVGTTHGTLHRVYRRTGAEQPTLVLAHCHGEFPAPIGPIAIGRGQWFVVANGRIHPIEFAATRFTPEVREGHAATIVEIAADGRGFVSGSSIGEVQLRGVGGEPIGMVTSPTHAVTSVGLSDRIVWAHDGEEETLLRWTRPGLAELPKITGVALASALDAERIAIVHRNRLATLELTSGSIAPVARGPKLRDPVRLAACARTIAVYERDHLMLVDGGTGSTRDRVEIECPFALAFSADGRQLAVSDERRVMEWTLDGSLQVGVVVEHDALIMSLAYAADDRLAIGDADGTVMVRAARTRASVERFTAHPAIVHALSWHGDQLVTGGGDHQLKLWK